MNTAKTAFGPGGEEGKERRNKAVEMTKAIECTMGPLPVPFQISRKATKLTRCFARVSLFLWKSVKGFSLEYGWIWEKREIAQVGTDIRDRGDQEEF